MSKSSLYLSLILENSALWLQLHSLMFVTCTLSIQFLSLIFVTFALSSNAAEICCFKIPRFLLNLTSADWPRIPQCYAMPAFVNFLQPIKTSTSISLRCLSDGSYITALGKEKKRRRKKGREKNDDEEEEEPVFQSLAFGHGAGTPQAQIRRRVFRFLRVLPLEALIMASAWQLRVVGLSGPVMERAAGVGPSELQQLARQASVLVEGREMSEL